MGVPGVDREVRHLDVLRALVGLLNVRLAVHRIAPVLPTPFARLAGGLGSIEESLLDRFPRDAR